MFTFAELARSQQPPNSITKAAGTVSGRFSIKKADEDQHEPHPVKRTEKNYIIFPTGSLG